MPSAQRVERLQKENENLDPDRERKSQAKAEVVDLFGERGPAQRTLEEVSRRTKAATQEVILAGRANIEHPAATSQERATAQHINEAVQIDAQEMRGRIAEAMQKLEEARNARNQLSWFAKREVKRSADRAIQEAEKNLQVAQQGAEGVLDLGISPSAERALGQGEIAGEPIAINASEGPTRASRIRIDKKISTEPSALPSLGIELSSRAPDKDDAEERSATKEELIAEPEEVENTVDQKNADLQGPRSLWKSVVDRFSGLKRKAVEVVDELSIGESEKKKAEKERKEILKLVENLGILNEHAEGQDLVIKIGELLDTEGKELSLKELRVIQGLYAAAVRHENNSGRGQIRLLNVESLGALVDVYGNSSVKMWYADHPERHPAMTLDEAREVTTTVLTEQERKRQAAAAAKLSVLEGPEEGRDLTLKIKGELEAKKGKLSFDQLRVLHAVYLEARQHHNNQRSRRSSAPERQAGDNRQGRVGIDHARTLNEFVLTYGNREARTRILNQKTAAIPMHPREARALMAQKHQRLPESFPVTQSQTALEETQTNDEVQVDTTTGRHAESVDLFEEGAAAPIISPKDVEELPDGFVELLGSLPPKGEGTTTDTAVSSTIPPTDSIEPTDEKEVVQETGADAELEAENDIEELDAETVRQLTARRVELLDFFGITHIPENQAAFYGNPEWHDMTNRLYQRRQAELREDWKELLTDRDSTWGQGMTDEQADMMMKGADLPARFQRQLDAYGNELSQHEAELKQIEGRLLKGVTAPTISPRDADATTGVSGGGTPIGEQLSQVSGTPSADAAGEVVQLPIQEIADANKQVQEQTEQPPELAYELARADLEDALTYISPDELSAEIQELEAEIGTFSVGADRITQQTIDLRQSLMMMSELPQGEALDIALEEAARLSVDQVQEGARAARRYKDTGQKLLYDAVDTFARAVTALSKVQAINKSQAAVAK